MSEPAPKPATQAMYTLRRPYLSDALANNGVPIICASNYTLKSQDRSRLSSMKSD